MSEPSKHSSWWRRLEDVFALRLQKTSSRRLDQDEHIRLTHTSSEDVLIKTNIFVLVIRLQDVFKRLQDVFKMSCKNVFKTSSRRLAKTSWRRFQSVFKTSCKSVFKTFSRRFENVFKVSLRRFCEYHEVELLLLKHFQDIFKTHSQRF